MQNTITPKIVKKSIKLTSMLFWVKTALSVLVFRCNESYDNLEAMVGRFIMWWHIYHHEGRYEQYNERGLKQVNKVKSYIITSDKH